MRIFPGYRNHFFRGRGVALLRSRLLAWMARPGETMNQSLRSTIHNRVSAYPISESLSSPLGCGPGHGLRPEATRSMGLFFGNHPMPCIERRAEHHARVMVLVGNLGDQHQ